MNIEKPEINSPAKHSEGNADKPKLETSKRLMLALEPTRLNFSKIEVVGEEHLSEIPEGEKTIIVTDHLNNLSIPLSALMMGDKLPIILTNQSNQFDTFGDGHLGVAVAGEKNFIGIDYNGDTSSPKPFNPKNFDKMAESLDAGYSPLIAAHNPVNTNVLPDKAGYGAAYLAAIADAWILPVATDIKSKKGVHITESGAGFLKNIKNSLSVLKERPEAEVIIGHPYKIADAENIKRFRALFIKHKNGEKLTPEETKEFGILRESLNKASEQIMKTIAGMLPESKRGNWGKEK